MAIGFSTSFDNSSSALFYPELKSLGISPIFISLNAIKSFVAGTGILFNFSLLLVTALSKTLHGSCNLLLALDSLSSILYLLSPFSSLWLTIHGHNFIPLSKCFLLQFVPIFGVSMAVGMILFISLERMISILFPVWFNRRNPKFYLPAIVAFSAIVAAFNLFLLSTVQSDDVMVMCSLPDCYRGEPGQTIYRYGLATILITMCCYAIIWVQMRRSLAKKKAKVANQATRRMFKSLVVIICLMFFGWVLDIVMRLSLPSMHLSSIAQLVLTNCLSNCSFIAAGSNAPILYTFSKDYRAAYNAQLNRFFKWIGLSKWHLMNSKIDAPTIFPPQTQPTLIAQNCPAVKRLEGGRSASIAIVGPINGWTQIVGPEQQQKQRQIRSISLREGKLTPLD